MEEKNKSVLSISGKDIKNCLMVAKILERMMIGCDVTENTTIMCNESNCKIEKGCRIMIHDELSKPQIKKVWNRLKNEFKLECAHYRNKEVNGCIYDYLSTDY